MAHLILGIVVLAVVLGGVLAGAALVLYSAPSDLASDAAWIGVIAAGLGPGWIIWLLWPDAIVARSERAADMD